MKKDELSISATRVVKTRSERKKGGRKRIIFVRGEL